MHNISQFYTLSDTKKYYGSEASLPLLIINTDKCNAVISLYGGQLLTFKATNKAPLLWLSPNAVFEEGVAIRGGIPICAPWFGEHSDFSLNHGFARISEWELASIDQFKNGDVVVILKLTENDLSKKYDYEQFIIELKITLGDTLKVEFSFENCRDIPQVCDWALHSYFYVENCKTTMIDGLESYRYQDQTRNNEIATLNERQTFTQEVDRLFENASNVQTIINSTPITIKGVNCHSVIVWNPGEVLAGKMNDVAQSEKFVCVERGAVKSIAWNITPNNKEMAEMTISN